MPMKWEKIFPKPTALKVAGFIIARKLGMQGNINCGIDFAYIFRYKTNSETFHIHGGDGLIRVG